MESVLFYEEEFKDLLSELQQYDYQFENLVFCGGGVKTIAYAGCIQVLVELEILNKCKRFAATSAGAIVASLLALEIDPRHIKNVAYLALGPLIFDHEYGYLSLLPNVLHKYGWNPQRKFRLVLENIIEEHTGDSNITFLQAYRRYKKELCLVAANVSTMSVEYFHHKTTPYVPIIVAVMSTFALPVIFQPVLCDGNIPQWYVDGGLTDNFPLHCFDGWYLSTKANDSFFQRLGSGDSAFEEYNRRTLGFLLFTSSEAETSQIELYNRQREQMLKRPNTELARDKQENCDKILKDAAKKSTLVEAGLKFLTALNEAKGDNSSGIKIDIFKEAFDKMKDTEDMDLLFGTNFSFEEAFKYLDKDADSTITFDEFVGYMWEKGVNFQVLSDKGVNTNIDTAGQYFGGVLNTVSTMSQTLHAKEYDITRTVGVYNDYVDLTNYDLEDEDKHFLVRQGVVGTMMYFKELVDKYTSGDLPSIMAGCVKPRFTSSLVSSVSALSLGSRSFPCQDSCQAKKHFMWGTSNSNAGPFDERDDIQV